MVEEGEGKVVVMVMVMVKVKMSNTQHPTPNQQYTNPPAIAPARLEVHHSPLPPSPALFPSSFLLFRADGPDLGLSF